MLHHAAHSSEPTIEKNRTKKPYYINMSKIQFQ